MLKSTLSNKDEDNNYKNNDYDSDSNKAKYLST